jgi:carbon-monoxide dehydrogenase small subunit
VELSPKVAISLEINGSACTLEVEPGLLLVDALRESCGLTGTRVGCLTGDCGACTVRVDGETRRSCLILAAAMSGRSVTTIEGLAPEGSLTAVQRAFCGEHGFQCGYCTAGMVLVIEELLAHEPHPDGARVREAIAGNLCRCTGYDSIIAAALAAASGAYG